MDYGVVIEMDIKEKEESSKTFPKEIQKKITQNP